ncbi:hypothetical protein HPY31_21405 [Brevibacillus sp. HB1.3]|uniref:hypothetical protein n=1 Tax=Brevibacillus sp. HB1.3 TaxID=2738842 RepID=UPI001557C688|nr:hypothetical protein [Brevibacillus sp. HB1.3]NQF16435.1 hypothetical protein [Brevibacillus sp. HB1.3]
MDWLIEIPFPSGEIRVETSVDISFRRFESSGLQEPPDFIHDIVLQWVIAPFVVHEHTAYRIPAHNDPEIEEYASVNFTSLFTKVRGICTNGKMEEIRLEDLKPNIKSSFIESVIHTSKIDPLVSDFYLQRKCERSNRLNVKLFQIDRDSFIKQTTYLPQPDHKRLWDFISRPFKTSDEVSISPMNWVLSDNLLESPFLLFLSRYASEVVLTVNEKDQNVTMVSFKE